MQKNLTTFPYQQIYIFKYVNIKLKMSVMQPPNPPNKKPTKSKQHALPKQKKEIKTPLQIRKPHKNTPPNKNNQSKQTKKLIK